MTDQFSSERVNVNQRNLFVRRTGGDLPAIILAHGFTDSGFYWSRLAADLAPSFNVIMPDMLGHGQSDPLGGITTVESFADDVVAILDHYGIESAGIGGHSMGGVTASVAAAKYPERIKAVMIEDPAWSPEPVPVDLDILIRFDPVKAWREDTQNMRAMSAEEVLAKVQGERPDWHPKDWEMYISDRLQFDMNVFEQIDFGVRAHWKTHLAQITAPVLLVTGEKALGGIVDDDFAQMILDIAQDGHLAKIKGAGHGIHREQYEAFRDAVLPFFKSTLL